MPNFKKPHNTPKRPSSVDGFITPPSGQATEFKKRFTTSYQPSNNQPEGRYDADGFYRKKPATRKIDEDFELPNSSSQDEFQLEEDVLPQQFNTNNFEDSAPEKKRFRLFRRKDKAKKHKSFKRKFFQSAGIVIVALVISVGALFGYGYIKTRQIFKGNGDGAAALERDVDPARLNGEGDGRVNVLLLGKGGPGHEAPDLTDTILLASIDPLQNEASLLSVPRDLYVEDENGYGTKINAIYSNAKQNKLAEFDEENDANNQLAEDAGLRAIKQSVADVLGVPVHYYVMVNFTAFQEAIDTVGGVTFNVEEPLYDASMAWLNNGNPLLADEGLQTFDGRRALYYARSRYGSARGDFDRTERQRQVIVALQQKVLSLGTFSNPFKVVELLNTLGTNVRTDLNGTSELKRLYEIGTQIGPDRIGSVGLADPPNQLVTTDSVNGQSVVLPVAGMFQYDEIQSYVRNTLRDAFLRIEDARVIILNGTTTAGLATSREAELRSYGYNIIGVDNAPTSDYATSRLIDLSGQKKYTRNYLEKRLGLTVSTEQIVGLPTLEEADFVIILGTDEAIKETE